MSKNIIRGREGEEMAAKYLEGKGYTVLERNFRSGRAEIDLVVRKENLLVFVEVKWRKRTAYGMPEDAVDDRKAELLLQAGENYIFKKDWKGGVRFDIVSITPNQGIDHFEDAIC